MSIYETADGRWGVDFRDERGKRTRKLIGTRQQAESVDAQLNAQHQQARATLQRFATGEGIDLPTAAALYLADLVYITEGTRTRLNIRLNAAARRIAAQTIGQVTPQLLGEYQEARRAELAPTTHASEMATLKQWFGWLTEQWYIASNPAKNLHTRKPPSAEPTPLSYQQEAVILGTPLLQQPVRLRIVIALDAGLRTGEILALRRNHIDFDQKTLKVWSTKTRRERTVPLTARLLRYLQPAGRLRPDALICARAARQLKTADHAMRALTDRTGVEVRMHLLRHTFGSRVAAACGNPFVVATLLGHSTIPITKGARLYTTTRIYVHPSLDELRAAVEGMERANPNSQTEGGIQNGKVPQTP